MCEGVGTNLLNSQTVAIKFVSSHSATRVGRCTDSLRRRERRRNRGRATHPSCATNTEPTRFSPVLVSLAFPLR